MQLLRSALQRLRPSQSVLYSIVRSLMSNSSGIIELVNKALDYRSTLGVKTSYFQVK